MIKYRGVEEFIKDVQHKLSMQYPGKYSINWIEPKCFHLVWFSKETKNMKAIFELRKRDIHWEVTYNGNKGELYIDTYTKVNHTQYPKQKEEE